MNFFKNIFKKSPVYENDGWTAITEATLMGNVEMVKGMVGPASCNATINDRRLAKGTTVLMVAAGKGNVEMVKVLIAAGADVNAKNKKGLTALDFAIDHPEIAAVLKAAGATG